MWPDQTGADVTHLSQASVGFSFLNQPQNYQFELIKNVLLLQTTTENQDGAGTADYKSLIQRALATPVPSPEAQEGPNTLVPSVPS